MVSIDRIQRGAARYADSELLSKAEGGGKWLMTGIVSLYLARLPHIIQQAKENPAIKLAGIISDDNMVDVESLINAVRPAARQSPASISIPFFGSVKLTESDLDSLYNHIMQS